jgi:hypothetical protein
MKSIEHTSIVHYVDITRGVDIETSPHPSYWWNPNELAWTRHSRMNLALTESSKRDRLQRAGSVWGNTSRKLLSGS